jgi:hypothetical protein
MYKQREVFGRQFCVAYLELEAPSTNDVISVYKQREDFEWQYLTKDITAEQTHSDMFA